MNPSSTAGNSAAEPPRFEVFMPAQAGLPPENGNLGVLGGAYNPITRAHLLLARYSREQFDLDEIIFVLPKTLPNKPEVDTSLEQRLEMMRIGVTGIPYISLGICTHGLFVDIYSAVQEIYPQEPEIFFITGRDAAERILNWPYADPAASLAQMFGAFQLLIFERQGKPELPPDPLMKQYANRIHTLETEEDLDHISSTKVRQRVTTGRAIEELVPPEVASYITRHDLYTHQSDQH
jgi:nicotinate-nucleotide adenylyltransferase